MNDRRPLRLLSMLLTAMMILFAIAALVPEKTMISDRDPAAGSVASSKTSLSRP